jgi:hypothetical protein
MQCYIYRVELEKRRAYLVFSLIESINRFFANSILEQVTWESVLGVTQSDSGATPEQKICRHLQHHHAAGEKKGR